MTQAPTPGPLSVAERYEQAKRDFNRMRDDGSLPAPTAPVEASGSERESDLCKAEKAITAQPGVKLALAHGTINVRQIARAVLAALRLQPSGETRDLLERATVIADDVERGKRPKLEAVDMVRELRNALLSARPLASGGQHSGGEIFHRNLMSHEDNEAWLALSTTPARAEAQDEGALSVLDRLLNYSGARGSFDAMKHGDAVKDAEELLRSVKSPSHTDLMVTPESIDAYMKVNPMEAQDEGAAGELKPCPFCGGEAEIIHLDDGDNAGGSCVCCTKCQASGNVEFGRKENFVDNWNRRAHPSPTTAADEDRVREAIADVISHEGDWRTALMAMDAAEETPEDGSGKPGYWLHQIKVLDRILAALKLTAAKEGEK